MKSCHFRTTCFLLAVFFSFGFLNICMDFSFVLKKIRSKCYGLRLNSQKKVNSWQHNAQSFKFIIHILPLCPLVCFPPAVVKHKITDISCFCGFGSHMSHCVSVLITLLLNSWTCNEEKRGKAESQGALSLGGVQTSSLIRKVRGKHWPESYHCLSKSIFY